MKKTLGSLILTLVGMLLSSAVAFGAHNVVLTWTPSADGTANPALAYKICRGTATGAEASTPINASPVAAACSSTTTCTYTDTSVSAASTYFYTVKALLNGVSSVPSNEASCTVPLAAPTGLAGNAN